MRPPPRVPPDGASAGPAAPVGPRTEASPGPPDADPDAMWLELERALTGDARARFAGTDRAALAQRLADGFARGAAAWPGIAVAPARFARELGTRLGDEAAPADLSRLRFADVYLAIACSSADPAAIEACDALAGRVLEACGARLRASASQIAEIRARVYEILFVDEATRPAATREFAGRGDLRGYLQVIATRALIRLVNRDRRVVAVEDLELLDALIPRDDPELEILRERYHADVDHAIRAATAALDERSRALLRYVIIAGWTVDQLGQLYGVHRATAARWVAEARAQLGAGIRRALGARLGIASEDVDSIIRLVQSRVDVSLERLLAD